MSGSRGYTWGSKGGRSEAIQKTKIQGGSGTATIQRAEAEAIQIMGIQRVAVRRYWREEAETIQIMWVQRGTMDRAEAEDIQITEIQKGTVR